MANRVVVTGFGCLTAAGPTATTTWERVKGGQSGIAPIATWDTTGWTHAVGAEIRDYNPRSLVPDWKLLKLLSRQDVIGLNAVAQAMESAALIAWRESLSDKTEFEDRTGVFAASGGNKPFQLYDYLPLLAEAGADTREFGKKLFDHVHPMWLLRTLPNNVLAYTGIKYRLKGPNVNIANHGVSGVQAISEAFRRLRNGGIDRAVAAGYERATEPEAFIEYGRRGVLSRDSVKCFDVDRDGTVLGEGAAAIILETLDAAKARNAQIQGEILGGSTVSEAYGILSIRKNGDGVKRAIRLALESAGCRPDEIGMVVAHADGTIESDATEALAISEVFGKNSVPVTGFKWALGYTNAAAGVIDSVLLLLSLNEGIVPGIPTLKQLATECAGLDVSARPRRPRASKGLLISRSFASLNSCLVLSSEVP